MRKIFRIKILFLVALVCGAGVFLLNNGLGAQEEKKAPASAAVASGAAWAVRCDPVSDGEKVVGEYCEMAQSISVTQEGADPATAQRLVEIAIGYPPTENSKAGAVVILPLGILLTEKITIDIDDRKEIDFNVRYCDVSGCIATFPLADKDIAKLGKGNVMQIKASAADGRPVVIELSLAGFTAAHDKIKPVKR